jgi:hypothetical protein
MCERETILSLPLLKACQRLHNLRVWVRDTLKNFTKVSLASMMFLLF